jgi:hypothetical protein
MDIRLLKAGESGFGMMIEHDAGYISPTDVRNQNLIREFKKLDAGDASTITVYVVLQKYGVKKTGISLFS